MRVAEDAWNVEVSHGVFPSHVPGAAVRRFGDVMNCYAFLLPRNTQGLASGFSSLGWASFDVKGGRNGLLISVAPLI